MVFRNLRERFGIDDQDYQVRGVFAKSEGLGSGGGSGSHRTSREPNMSTVLVLRLPVVSHSSPGSLSPVLVGSWRGEGLRSASHDASQAQAPLPGREHSGRERGLRKLLHCSLTFPV